MSDALRPVPHARRRYPAASLLPLAFRDPPFFRLASKFTDSLEERASPFARMRLYARAFPFPHPRDPVYDRSGGRPSLAIDRSSSLLSSERVSSGARVFPDTFHVRASTSG